MLAGFSAGPNFPQESFANDNGFAKIGFNINSIIKYKLSDYFGVMSTIHVQANTIHYDRVSTYFQKSGTWDAYSVLLGGFVSLMPNDMGGNIDFFYLLGCINTSTLKRSTYFRH